MPTITPLPDPPSRADPASFADKGDAWNGALPTFSSELQGVADAVMAAVALQGSSATSTTSLTIGTGSKTLTVETGRAYVPGVDVSIAYATDAAQRMIGIVTAYDTGTGALTVNVTSYSGSGTYADWEIGMALAVSFDGRTYQDLRVAGKMTEAAFSITGTTPVISPANGMTQSWVLTGNSTPTSGFSSTAGESQTITLLIRTGAYTLTWSSMGVTWVAGVAPAAVTSGYAVCVLFTLGATRYGAYLGTVA